MVVNSPSDAGEIQGRSRESLAMSVARSKLRIVSPPDAAMVRSRSGGGPIRNHSPLAGPRPLSPGQAGGRACSLPGLPSLCLDLNLDRRTMLVRSAGGDHEIAALHPFLPQPNPPDHGHSRVEEKVQ